MTISRRNTIEALFPRASPVRKRLRKSSVAACPETAAIGRDERVCRTVGMAIRRAILAVLVSASAVPAVAAITSQAAFLSAYHDWSAFVRQVGKEKVCYVLSEPKAKEPARVKRDPAYFLINDWPGRRSRGEAEIVPGYRYRDGSTVTVTVGGDKVDFFTKNEGDAGGGWVLNPADEKRLLRAMRSGTTAVVTGTSRRGTVTKDVYGLSGVGDALDRIHKACAM